MLLKELGKVLSGKSPNPFLAYLGDTQKLLSTKSAATTVSQFLEPDHLQQALATRSVYFAK